MEFTCDWYFSSLEKSPYRRINEILTYCSMMYPVSEENYWEEHGEEGFNLPTYMERKTRFIYMFSLCHIFGYSLSLSLSLSPLISLQVWIQKFWKWLRSKRGDEMNLIYMYIKKSNMCIDYIYFSFFPYWISIYAWFQ